MKINMMFFSSVMLLLLSFSFIFFLLRRKGKRKGCDTRVVAQVVKILESNMGSVKTYCPVYKYSFNGKEYEVKEESYTNVGIPSEKDRVELFISSENPEHFWNLEREKTATRVGVLFILGSVLVALFFFMLSQL